MKRIALYNATLINEGERFEASVLIENGIIAKIDRRGSGFQHAIAVDYSDCLLIPGAIDDQVHFREPGLTHKVTIASESAAAVAGGITSYMEMPNTVPPALNHALLEEKYALAKNSSCANYSFYLGAGNNNLEEIKAIDPKRICGLKIFMGSSTGNLLVDDPDTLYGIFCASPVIIATHCETDSMIRSIQESFIQTKGAENLNASDHARIRSRESCLASSSLAIRLARESCARLHVLHISTAEETHLFEIPKEGEDKRITAEACIHHLWFSDEDYNRLGNRIKWNPSIKTKADREAIRQAVKEGRIDVIATDHAPHTLAEKMQPYLSAPSGGPLVQHAIPAMLDLVEQGVFTQFELVEKMCHAPARLFNVTKRGFLREGYAADLVIVKKGKHLEVNPDNILSKCKWSPFEGHAFSHYILATYVNGNLAYSHQSGVDLTNRGMRLTFDRD